MKILMYVCMLRWIFFPCMFHDEVACLHVERHMVMGAAIFSCMLCDDVACLHIERNSLVGVSYLDIEDFCTSGSVQ